MTTYLGKSCSFGLPRVPFVNCRQFIYLVISLLVLRAGCGIWLYQFLIIAYLFTLITWSMHYQSLYNHLIVRITKRHNSVKTDSLDPFFLSHVHCVMVQVWYKIYQNRTKIIEVIRQNLICWRNEGITEFRTCWKQYTPPPPRHTHTHTIPLKFPFS